MCDIGYSNFRMHNLFVILVLILAFQGHKHFVNASSRDLDADLHEGPGNEFSNFYIPQMNDIIFKYSSIFVCYTILIHNIFSDGQ